MVTGDIRADDGILRDINNTAAMDTSGRQKSQEEQGGPPATAREAGQRSDGGSARVQGRPQRG